ncbi:DsbA family protein [Pseudorhodobacter sp. MZDSW-24AT]|uniref:DsbA family protein n=1 Tax=Pseudorhodobacter sp. MZDSW-24AT TaxID=2052957 RepID=UPI000C1E2B12|nr:DsbA family protein [Pseudorhodobacter sp. MZDSW-24AT]PJF10945.1 disulfide bond formation protein DsbA [Pseudorhodobacter sp. MZDSW-24AT]
MILRTLIGITAMMMTSTVALAEMTESEREAFRAEVRAFLLEEPEVLVEAMEVLQMQQEQDAVQRDLAMLRDNAEVIYRDPNSWAGGNLEADLTIVEFVDYRCGYCRRAHDEVAELVESDGNIRLVLKEFPILGEQSTMASQFAIAVRQLHGDDAYKSAHDALITLRGDVTPETLARLATDLGHDPAALAQQMQKPEVQAVIDANHALGAMMEINGTPTFVIDETMVRGYVPLQGMQQIVAGQREG